MYTELNTMTPEVKKIMLSILKGKKMYTFKKLAILMLDLYVDMHGPKALINLLKNQEYSNTAISEISEFLFKKNLLLIVLNEKKGNKS
jgi:hypothetical protein